MLDLKAVRQRAATRVSVAIPANPANWLIEDIAEPDATPANPANRLIHKPPISQLATLAGVASEKQPVQSLAEALADAINRACDVRHDDDANRAGLLAECAALPPEGQADMLAHFTVEAARWVAPAPDARVTCCECSNYRPAAHRCVNHRAASMQAPDIGPDLAALPQYCPGWKGKTEP